jgi:hypothetical protein
MTTATETAALGAVGPKMATESVPFVLAGALPQLGYRAEEISRWRGRELELCDLARDAAELAEWCRQLAHRVHWSGPAARHVDDQLHNALYAATQLAGLALLAGSDGEDARHARSAFTGADAGVSCPLRNALTEVGHRLQEYRIDAGEVAS